MLKIMGWFSGSQEPVRIFYIEINEKFIFDLQLLTFMNIFNLKNYTHISTDGYKCKTTDKHHMLWLHYPVM
jgi:hypothetical protein